MKFLHTILTSSLLWNTGIEAFSVPTKSNLRNLQSKTLSNDDSFLTQTNSRIRSTTSLFAEKGTIQILMSDTGGGHRASANALRDAFDELYPGQIEVDIVDIFTDYGPFFPFDAFVPIYKILAEYPFLWGWTFYSGATPLGLWFNELVLEVRVVDYEMMSS